MQPPTWSYSKHYYQRLIEGTRLLIRTDDVRGKGLFAQGSFTSDEIILSETALVAAQSLEDTVLGVPVCEMCLVSLESPRRCVLRVSKSASLTSKLPFPKVNSVRSAEPCRYAGSGCKSRFCSPRCRELAWERFHSVLCRGMMSSDQQIAWDTFLESSWDRGGVDYSDTVALALRLIAQAVAASRLRGESLRDAYAPVAMLIKAPLEQFTLSFLLRDSQEEELAEDLRPAHRWERYSQHASCIERHPIVVAANVGEVSKEQFLENGHALVCRVLALTDEERAFFTVGIWSDLLGATLLNSQERAPPSSYVTYRDQVESLPGGKEACESFERQLEAASVSVADLERSSRGQGVYPVGCLFNHSCDPNALVAYSRLDDESISVVAMRNIEAGEEICISYIDETLPYESRQQQLEEHYFFTCQCPKCAIPPSEST